MGRIAFAGSWCCAFSVRIYGAAIRIQRQDSSLLTIFTDWEPEPDGKSRGKAQATTQTSSWLRSQSKSTLELLRRTEESEQYITYLREWEIGCYVSMAAIKRYIFADPLAVLKLPFSPLFEHLQGWFIAFLTPFRDGILRQIAFEKRSVLESDDGRF